MNLEFRFGHRGSDGNERGQILVIFAVAFAVIIMMLALLFDGARATVLRRQLQDASDASALAAANTFQGLAVKGCSTTTGAQPGPPQAQVVAAAKASVQTNLPGYDLNNVAVTCVGLNNNVQVVLGQASPSYFGSIFGGGGLTASTRSVAQNGYDKNNAFSVVLLDPSHYSWPNGQRGCPAFGVNGGITAQFDSTVFIDSGCDVAHGGAFAPNGGSATVDFATGFAMRIVGEYQTGALTVNPPPQIHMWPPKKDPMAGLVPPPGTPPGSALTIRSPNKLIINGSQNAAQCAAKGLLGGNPGCILRPGVYVGGIDLRSSAEVYLRPGIYVLQDGGLSLGAQSKVFSISSSATTATTLTWDQTDCPAATCGVLIFKTTVASPDPISVTAGATFMVRAFNPDVDTTTYPVPYDTAPLRHVLIWQYGPWPPTGLVYPWGPTDATGIQPQMQLQGGGDVVMSGAVYAPSAPVDLHGTSGGSSGTGTVDLTIQFIVWDMSLSGNASFHFRYSAEEFPKALDYGLVE